MDPLRVVGALISVFGMSALMHWYVGRRLVQFMELSDGTTRILFGLLIVHAVALPSIVLTFPLTGRPWVDALQYGGYVTMGFLSLAVVLVMFRDVGLLALSLLGRILPGAVDFDPARRLLLGQAVSFCIAIAATGIGVAGWFGARRRPSVERVEVPIEGLAPALEGFRIAQISDLHAGSTIKRDAFEDVVAQINDLKVDLVAVTGDMVDGSVAVLAPYVAPLAELSSRHGTFFVTGNHEYYSGAGSWCTHCEDALDMEVLNNRHVVLDHDGAPISVVGVTDQRAGSMLEGHASDPRSAFAGVPESLKLVLAHQPTSAYAAAKLGGDLQLSGHTHAGQYFPFTTLARLVLPFARGLHRVGRMWLYVNRGTTFWGPPMRLDAEQEITLLELRRA